MVHIQIESNQYWYFYLTILAGSRPAEQSVFICSHEFFSPISRDCLTIRWWAHYQNIIKTIEVFLKTKKFCLLTTLVRFYTPNEERMNWLQRSLAKIFTSEVSAPNSQDMTSFGWKLTGHCYHSVLFFAVILVTWVLYRDFHCTCGDAYIGLEMVVFYFRHSFTSFPLLL